MFAHAGSVAISGGQFNEFSGDQIVNIASLQVTVVAQPGHATSSEPSNLPKICLSRSSRQVDDLGLDSPTVPKTPQFSEVELLLQVITNQLAVCPAKFADLLRNDVSDLIDTVAFCKRAYEASKSTTLYPLLNRQTVKRMEHCGDALKRVHTQILRLPYPSILSWRETGQIILGWFVGSNQIPDDILAIRLELIEEIELLGEFLRSLKSTSWATGLWTLVAKDGLFTLQGLTAFFATGSRSLKSLRVEEIIVIEPLGQPLSVPLRFASSLEDIHRFLQLGCHGTKGSAFIEDRQYQLDESTTNTAVHQRDLNQYLMHGTVLEVSILVKAADMQLSECPRCGELGSGDHPSGNAWVRCKGCRLLFQTAESLQSKLEEGSGSEESLFFRKPPSNDQAPSGAHASQSKSSEPLPDFNLARFLFRRLKLDVVTAPRPSETSVASSSGNPAGGIRRFGTNFDMDFGKGFDFARGLGARFSNVEGGFTLPRSFAPQRDKPAEHLKKQPVMASEVQHLKTPQQSNEFLDQMTELLRNASEL